MNLHFLAAQTPHGDPYALLLLAVLVVAFVIWVLVNKSKKKKAVAEPAPVIVEEAPKSVAPGSAGQLKLHNVEPKTAAMLMAIVADQMGKPLNELRFISIKEVDE
jgi:hypothetical protein